MNKRPVSYLQTDQRWKSKPYRVTGEQATIGSAGCGPSCAAMVIETLTGKTFTPEDACNWSMAHGYKALNQGTYYSYFKPQMAAYGIDCKQLLASRIINQPNHPIHEQVKQYLADGYYVIALMGPGTWTKGGHFVLLWAWDDKVRINDPASTRAERLNGDPDTFRREARCYWLIDARQHNRKEEDDDMTKEDVIKIIQEYEASKAQQAPGAWSAEDRAWAEGVGLIAGDGNGNMQYKSPATREQMMVFLHRFYKLFFKK